MRKSIIFLSLFISANLLFAQNMVIPAERIIDQIRGGLLGQNLGMLNGLPYEFKFIEQPGNVSGYVPSLPEGAKTDDDTDFEWVYIYHMQKTEPVVRLDDTDVQHHTLAVDLRNEVIENIRSNDQQLQARGAYFAICLGIDQEIYQDMVVWKDITHF